MKIGWIGGWGVSLEEMKAIAVAHAPDAEHLIYPPVVGAAENLSNCDAVIAWSLGAHLVLEAGARGVKLPAKVLLFAPFTSFCSEHGKCGKHSETQVKWLRRWIDTDAPAALAASRRALFSSVGSSMNGAATRMRADCRCGVPLSGRRLNASTRL